MKITIKRGQRQICLGLSSVSNLRDAGVKRKFITLLLAAGAVFLLASCNKEELDGNGQKGIGGGDIRFEISIGTSGGTPQLRSVTYADFSAEFEDGDQIGLFAVKHASGSVAALTASDNYLHNVKLTYNKAENKWNTDAGVNLYWPGSGDQLDFYAYYPYDAAATNPTAIIFDVQTDQSTAANYGDSDLMTARAANTAKTTNAVQLIFSHALALVQVEVPAGTMKGGGPRETLGVMLNGVKAAATVNLGVAAGDEVTLAATGNIPVTVKMLRVETDLTATTYTYRALVPAQTIADDSRLFLLSQDGYNLMGSKTAALTLSAGKAEKRRETLPSTLLYRELIPAGTFQMGSPVTEPNRYVNLYDDLTNETQHRVTLTKGFYMSKYEITNAQYAAFLNAKGIGSNPVYNGNTLIDRRYSRLTHDGTNWKVSSGYEDDPVVGVTWYGADEFARWVGGSLPTEAQWEYACRGDKGTAPFGVGDGTKLYADMVNFNGTYPYELPGGQIDNYQGGIPPNTYLGKTAKVGSYLPNSYGLYDMHGNVFEWCSDWYYYTYGLTVEELAGTVTDPTGPASGVSRVLRGGSWLDLAQSCRSASRISDYPGFASSSFGFRVVFVP